MMKVKILKGRYGMPKQTAEVAELEGTQFEEIVNILTSGEVIDIKKVNLRRTKDGSMPSEKVVLISTHLDTIIFKNNGVYSVEKDGYYYRVFIECDDIGIIPVSAIYKRI